MRDLEGPRSYYMEGTVSGLEVIRGSKRYIIEVERGIAGGKEYDDFPSTIIPPINGTRTLMGRVTDGVEVVS
ncbi:MAG: hypothetical protein H8E12_08945 [Rhodobacteraceae bacterium]|nr:hypothetical protein [Paracoccaceae bacterium]